MLWCGPQSWVKGATEYRDSLIKEEEEKKLLSHYMVVLFLVHSSKMVSLNSTIHIHYPVRLRRKRIILLLRIYTLFRKYRVIS